jgi:cytoskeleton protein RodZ
MAETVSELTAGPGSTLRKERESLGVTLREVSETLNLSITVIQAIEADDYKKLPGPVFARGYIRAYARLLSLEPEPLLARSPGLDEAGTGGVARSEAPLRAWVRRRPGLVLGVGLAFLVLLLLFAAIRLWPELQAEADAVGPADTQGTPVNPDEHPWDPGASRSGQSSADAEVLAEVEEIADEVLGVSDAVAAAPSPAALGGTALVQAERPSAGSVRITPSGNERLALRFSADCWVQVRDSRGSDLYSELSRAGDDLELIGQGPLRILLGYAPGVQLAFNGEPVPLGPHTRNNVATLVLGH